MRRLQKFVSSAVLAVAVTATASDGGSTELQCGLMNITGIGTMPGTEGSSSRSYTPLAAFASVFSQSCLHVQFTAQFRSKTPKAVLIRATFDGVAAGLPNVVALTTSGGGFDERAMTFIMPAPSDVATHTVGIEFRSQDGAAVNVRNGLLRVQYTGVN